MEEVILVLVLKKIMFVSGVLGILTGIDLVLGAKVMKNLKKTLEGVVFNADKVIIKISSLFRETVDSGIYLDEKMIQGKTRVVLGILFIVVSVFMIVIVRRA
jgi:hypothetical protein